MKKNKLLIVCLIIGAVGVLFAGVGLILGGRVYGIQLGSNGVFVNSNYNNGQEDAYSFNKETMDLDEFTNISMDIKFADVKVIVSDHYGVEYCVRNDRPIEATVNAGSLTITQKNSLGDFSVVSVGTFNYGGIDANEYVYLYIPADVSFGTVTISNDCGDIDLDDLLADSITINDSFGSFTANSMNANTISFDFDSGDIKVATIVAEQLNVENSFGSVKFDNGSLTNSIFNLDSGDLNLGVISGDSMQVNISFGALNAEEANVDTVIADLDSGDCTVDRLTTQSLDIDSNFGEVVLGIAGNIASYGADVETDFGSVEINREDYGTTFKTLDSENGGMLTIYCDSGDIVLKDVD